MLAELDGYPVGETTRGRFGVDPGSLIVRLPVPVAQAPGLSPRTSVTLDSPTADTVYSGEAGKPAQPSE